MITFIKNMLRNPAFWTGYFVAVFTLCVDDLINHFDYGNLAWAVSMGVALVFWGWTYGSELPSTSSDVKTDTGRNEK